MAGITGSNAAENMDVLLLCLLCVVLCCLCDGLITPSEESYRLWVVCQIVCDLQTSTNPLYEYMAACQFSKIHIFRSYFCMSHFNIIRHSTFIVPLIFYTCISNQNIFATSAHCCLLHRLGVNNVQHEG